MRNSFENVFKEIPHNARGPLAADIHPLMGREHYSVFPLFFFARKQPNHLLDALPLFLGQGSKAGERLGLPRGQAPVSMSYSILIP